VKPWQVAQALFDPPDETGVRSVTLGRLGFWRSAFGLATLFVIGLSFGKSAYASAVDNGVDVAVNAVISLAVMLVCVVVGYVFTRSGLRGTLVPGTWRMLRNVVLVLLTVGAPIALVNLLLSRDNPAAAFHLDLTLFVCGTLPALAVAYRVQRGRLTRAQSARYRLALAFTVVMTLALAALVVAGVHSDTGAWRLVAAFAGLAPAVWWLLYAPFAVYWTARTVMWVGEVHPMLAPIGTGLLVAVVFSGKVTGRQGEEVPFDIWLPMSLTGLVTTFLLAAFEIRHLRKRGVGLRTGTCPAPS
jgi:hypothetical protein